MSNNITFVTHLRYDHDDRLNNLQTIIDYYSKHFPQSKFIFVEDGESHCAKFDSIKWNKKTSFYFIKNPGVYHRTFALNYGFKRATTPIVVSLDTDCIVSSESIVRSETALLDDCTCAWPYNGYFLDIDFETKTEFLQNNMDYQLLIDKLNNNLSPALGSNIPHFYVRCTNDPKHHLGVGGIVMFNRNRFLAMGGYNPNYIGWGCEDNDIKIRMNTLEQKTYRDTDPSAICFHLFHRNASRANNPYYEQNFDIVRRVESMTKDQLLKYTKTWSSFESDEKN